MSRLDRYREKRDFDSTPEPTGNTGGRHLALRYSMQKHAATRLHWDLRLEWDGGLLSWAITRGPSLDPAEKRLAVETEDHPLDYLTFEGLIPKGSYGAGTVMLWDIGYWQPTTPVEAGLKKGHLAFALHGQRMTGHWDLVRMKREGKRTNWLLIKQNDEAAGRQDPVEKYNTSVATGRDMAGITANDTVVPPQSSKGASPRWRKPQLATVSDTLGDPARRWHELKFDGYRALISIGKSGTRVFTRNGHDWSDRFASLLGSFSDLKCDSALIDGEIIVGAGLHGFGTLQKAIKLGGPFQYQAFDLLNLDEKSLVGLPLSQRREALEKICAPLPPLGSVQLSPILEGDPQEAFDSVCGLGGEGLISKLIDAPYRGGRSRAWEKIKCEKRGEFLVIGWQASESRGRAFASLALAAEERGRLRYLGKVGTGFDADTMDEIAARLKILKRKTPPAEVSEAEARAMTWVTPKLVAEVRYAELTDDGRLRHAVFLGLRDDKAASEVAIEEPSRVRLSESDLGDKIAGIQFSSADRRVFPDARITKGEVARYYETVAEEMLPHVAYRPLSLLRLPEGLSGERFFQKHIGKGFPDAIRTVRIGEKEEDGNYMSVNDAAGLVAAVQMGTLEFHIWGAQRDRLDRPDRLVFDLDPDEELKFANVKSAAVEVRDVLNDLGLPSWPLLTGGKGLHVVVPLRRTSSWPTVTLFARTLAEVLARDHPDRYTATMSKKRRKGRIFIDWMRNERAATAIAPWSVRARPGAPVAVPLTWEELAKIRRANAFTLKTAPERLTSLIDFPAPRGLSERVIARLSKKV